MVAAQQTLAEAYPGRHLLGLGLGGVSQLEAMRTYLDRMDGIALVTPKPAFQPVRVLAVEHAVVLETDPHKARRIARAHLETYLQLPAHLAKFRRLGFTDDDFAAGGSNRLVDALVAWGHMDDVLAKLQAHFEAGADHVCIQVLGSEPGASPIQAWRILAKAILHR